MISNRVGAIFYIHSHHVTPCNRHQYTETAVELLVSSLPDFL
jgi:hypothetical protein